MQEAINHIYGNKLKLLRTSQFISQKDLALKFEISQQSYSDLEKGYTNFSVKKIEYICKIFNIKVDEFITTNSKQRKTKKPNSPAIKILKKHYERLLLEKDIRIGELEIEAKRLKKNKKNSNSPPEVYVMI